jgi:ABC-type transport system involved in multi-copper enzyme maturation permease subunit
MRSIIYYTILTALRDWLYLGIYLLVILAFGFSIFLGDTAVVEQSNMSIAFIGGATRMVVIIGLILFVCFHIRRSFDNKDIELMLTKPISRVEFIISYYISLAILAGTVIFPILMLIYLLVASGYLWGNSSIGIFYWGISLYFESLIVIGFAFFASLILSSAVSSTLVTFAFYFLTRILGFFLVSINNPASTLNSSLIGKYSQKGLELLSLLFPRLDMFAKSEWLVYGVSEYDQYLLFLSMSFIYIPLLVTMATYDFVRKQF